MWGTSTVVILVGAREEAVRGLNTGGQLVIAQRIDLGGNVGVVELCSYFSQRKLADGVNNIDSGNYCEFWHNLFGDPYYRGPVVKLAIVLCDPIMLGAIYRGNILVFLSI